MAADRKSVKTPVPGSDPKIEPRRAALIVGLAGLLGIPTAIFVQSRFQPRSSSFQLIDITGVDYGRGFQLPDQHGTLRSLADFRGEVAVVFFGFTQCPDVCPTTLTEIVEARKLLGAQASKLRAIFITIDPERDTAEVLEAYVRNFDPTFVALRPPPGELEKLTSEFKVYVKKNPSSSSGTYSFDHTAASFVFDPQGRLRLYARYGAGPAALAADARRLLEVAA